MKKILWIIIIAALTSGLLYTNVCNYTINNNPPPTLFGPDDPPPPPPPPPIK